MNIIPPYISEEDPTKEAERRVLHAFKQIDIPSKSFLFHSVNLPEHQYKEWGEIDFLLISKSGILVFEVKGGGISRENGVWIGTNRYGKKHVKYEGPNDQAKSAKYALQKELNEEFPYTDFKKIPFGWALIFPDIDYASRDLELPKELVCDYDSMESIKFDSFINNVYKYFKKKTKDPKELGSKEIQEITNYIRPNIDLVPKLKTSIDETNLQLIKGTEEQYRVLSDASDNNRILCTGGGGTGKTLLAIEIAKREIDKKILVTCKSPVLAEFIKGQVSNEMIHVMSIFEVQESYLGNPQTKPIYDMIIVDEGQDLLSLEVLEYLDSLLIHGFENGCWRWFMDNNNQANVDDQLSPIDLKIDSDDSELALEWLKDFIPTKINLSQNCRNTEQIIYDTQLNTGADIGIARIKGKGHYPRYEKTSSSEKTTTKLEAILEKWHEEQVKLNDIVILSAVNYSLSSAANLSRKWQDRIQILTKENVLKQNPNKVLFSTIREYKGLDKPVVAVIDIEKTMDGVLENIDMINSKVESFLYVAMTRSNRILWITVDEKFQKFLDEQQPINYKKMTER